MAETIHIFWNDAMLSHYPGHGVFDTLEKPDFIEVFDKHPENADRIRNMLSILRKGPIASFVEWHDGRKANIDELYSFHTKDYVSSLVEADSQGGKLFCPGTKLNPGSFHAALVAAGTALTAMDFVLKGNSKLAFALVRPPGHHAQPTMADGYCFLNNAGLAAQLAISSGLKRVALVDIDVHFGNGTSEGFYERNYVLTISLHMDHGSWGETHPQSLQADQIGKGEGIGFNLNIPLPSGTGDRGYEMAMKELVQPAIDSFGPNMIIFVIGQDSSQFDPNGRQCLSMDGYRRIGSMIRAMAERHSDGRVLVVQEGGYHITYSAYCLHATLEGLLQVDPPLLEEPMAYYPEDLVATEARINEIKNILAVATSVAS